MINLQTGEKLPNNYNHRRVKVVYATQNVVEFEESWFLDGELLQDHNDSNHDIELIKLLNPNNNKRFTYLGTAKVGEIYYIKR